MLHHIIVKWNPTVDRQDAAIKVRAMYAKATELPGMLQSEKTSYPATTATIL